MSKKTDQLAVAAFLSELNPSDPVAEKKIYQGYLQAAEAGDGASAAKLSQLLQAGTGTPVDIKAATKWAEVAAKQGFKVPEMLANISSKAARRKSTREILVISVDVDANKVVIPSLKKSGYKFYAVDTIAKARDLLGKHTKIGLVLSDLHLPQASGLNAVATLRPVRANLAFALMGNKPSADEIAQMKAAGVVGFVMKPFKKNGALSVIDRVCLAKPK